MKAEQEFKENILKSLSKELMTTFNNSIENMTSKFTALKEEWKQRFEDTNDRITQEAKLAKEEKNLLKKELIDTINQNNEDKNIKIDNIEEEAKKYKLSNQEMFEDLSKTFNNKFEDILSKYDTTSSNIKDIIANSQHDKAEFNKKVNDLSSNLIVKVKALETNDQNLLERTKDLDQNITCI